MRHCSALLHHSLRKPTTRWQCLLQIESARQTSCTQRPRVRILRLHALQKPKKPSTDVYSRADDPSVTAALRSGVAFSFQGCARPPRVLVFNSLLANVDDFMPTANYLFHSTLCHCSPIQLADPRHASGHAGCQPSNLFFLHNEDVPIGRLLNLHLPKHDATQSKLSRPKHR